MTEAEKSARKETTCAIIGGSPDFFCRREELEGCFIIAADGGYDRCLELSVHPDIIVGDHDSSNAQLPSDIEVITAPREKDDTDTILAVRTAWERGYRDFGLYGVTGGRTGHMLASVFTLELILSMGGAACLRDRNGDTYIQGTGTKIYSAEGFSYVSVFSLTDSTELAMRGFKYGGEGMKISRSYPIGVSNEFAEKGGEIEVFSGRILVVCEK
ncbi:MAG: thiamine diphosphokinase [Huintestinicola sp.]